MKLRIRDVLLALWRRLGPVRKPFQARLETFLAGCLARALEDQNPARVVADEVNLVLDTVVAEQFRLQEQIEDIRRLLSGAPTAPVPPPPAAPPLSRAVPPSPEAITDAVMSYWR